MVVVKRKGVRCFELSREEQCDATRLVTFAEKVPGAMKDKDKRINDRNEFYRQACQRNINLLWRNPALNDLCFSWMQGQVADD